MTLSIKFNIGGGCPLWAASSSGRYVYVGHSEPTQEWVDAKAQAEAEDEQQRYADEREAEEREAENIIEAQHALGDALAL